MGWLASSVLAGVAIVVALGAMGAWFSARRRLDAERAHRRLAEIELQHARASLDELGHQVAELTADLGELRHVAMRSREMPDYVITSLMAESSTTPVAQLIPVPAAHRRAQALEDSLVGVLAHQQDVSRVRTRVVELVVRTVALGHGVRRALSPDVLDRAAAEAHVARRRSRRNRKREEREAKRLLRAVKEQRAA
jgi:hypothetical protein